MIKINAPLITVFLHFLSKKLDSEYGNGSWVNQTGAIPVSKRYLHINPDSGSSQFINI
jgi:hypothetical protein